MFGWVDDLAKEAEKVGGGIMTTAQNAANNVVENPLGAAGGALAAVSMAPAIVVAAPTAIGLGAVAYGAAAGTDALGITHGARESIEEAAKWAAEHPADVGQYVTQAQLLIAGAAVGGEVGGALNNLSQGWSPPETTSPQIDTGSGMSGSPAPNEQIPVPPAPSSAPASSRPDWWTHFTGRDNATIHMGPKTQNAARNQQFNAAKIIAARGK